MERGERPRVKEGRGEGRDEIQITLSHNKSTKHGIWVPAST